MPAERQSRSTASLYAARIELSGTGADFMEAYLSETEDGCWALWRDSEKGAAAIECYGASDEEAAGRVAAMTAILRERAPVGIEATSVSELPPENWAETWKRFFHAERLTPRIWVKPSWEACPAPPGEVVVELDPGMSFGTGQHGTTRACLQMLDARAAEGTPAALAVLDVGCGSGILAIAAAKLGFRRTVAVDNDPVAVEIARTNARLNGVADAVEILQADLETAPLPSGFDLVIANILAGTLIANAGTLAAALKPGPGSRLILSGLLATEADEVLAAFAPLGLRLRPGGKVVAHSRPTETAKVAQPVGQEWLSTRNLPAESAQGAASMRIDLGEWSTLLLSRL